MRNVRALIAYDGAKFFGWQRQEGFVSVPRNARDRDRVADELAPLTSTEPGAPTPVSTPLARWRHFHLATSLDDDRFAPRAQRPPTSVRLHPPPRDLRRRLPRSSSTRAEALRLPLATSRFAPTFGRDYTHWVRDPLDLRAMARGRSALRRPARLRFARHQRLRRARAPCGPSGGCTCAHAASGSSDSSKATASSTTWCARSRARCSTSGAASSRPRA
jgi:hypothetical protein